MAMREIITVGDPRLREHSRPVEEITPALRQLIDDMVETMHEADGIGLAAPQIAELTRVIVIELPEDEDVWGSGRLYAVINPEIVKEGRQTEVGVEGCLSIPGYVGEVERATEIVVRGISPDGERFRLRPRGFLARVFQHQGEFDMAKDTLQECVQVAGAAQDKADCLYELAQTQYYLRNMKGAKAALEELMALPRESVAIETRTHAAFVLADIYEHQREFGKACELLESILEEHPNPKAVRARLGLIK